MLIPRVGEQLGEFELIRRIGAGGMGVVYEARETATGRRVALKILSPAMTREKNRQRFLREAEAAGRLQHPNIVGVYAIHQDAELCYYAMELIDGWPLSRVRELLGVTGSTRLPLPELMRTHADLFADVDHAAATVVEGVGEGKSIAPSLTPPKPPLAKGGNAADTTVTTEGAVPDQATSPTEAGGQDTQAPVEPTAGGDPTTIGAPQLPIPDPQPAISGQSILGNVAYVRQVVVMLRDIARALHYAHQQGVTHRDVKPDNLLLDHEGQLHLVDFGLARILEDDNITLTGELMGTPLYMSPEQVAAGRIGIDHRTDIYSLGVVLYHMLCLQPPYEAPTREALLRAILVHAPQPLSSRNPAVPRELEAIVHHALEKDPDRRYASGAEMADDLDRWLDGQPISLRLPGRLERWWTQMPRRKRRTLAGALSAVLAVSVGVAGFAIWSHWPKPIPATQPAGPGEALALAATAAEAGNFLRSALWYSQALERNARVDELPALRLASVYGQLTPLVRRVSLANGEYSWRLHPSNPLCLLTGREHGFCIWDLATAPEDAEPIGPIGSVRWMAYDQTGKYVWSIEAQPDGDVLQLWTPMGEAVTAEPLKVAGRIVGLRSAYGPKGHTVAVMTSATLPGPDAAPIPAELFDAIIYRLRSGQPPEVLVTRIPNLRQVELSPQARYMAFLTSDNRLAVGYLEGRTPEQKPVLGTVEQFRFSPSRQQLALAGTTGEMSLREADEPNRPMHLDTTPDDLRAIGAPAYLRYSPDGKYLLIVGSDTQNTPPYLRSIDVVDTRTTNLLFSQFGRDAFFSEDSRTFIWWDHANISLLGCAESQLFNRLQFPVEGLARSGASEKPRLFGLPSPPDLPVSADAQARRLLCLEPTDSATGTSPTSRRARVWDAQTGERLDVLIEAPNIVSCALDADGRFALVQTGADQPELFEWDLGGPETAYPRCVPFPVTPVPRDDVRLTRAPLVATLSQESGRMNWQLIDPATLRTIGRPIAARNVANRWLVSDDASTLVQITLDRIQAWSFSDGGFRGELPVPRAVEAVIGLSPTGRLAAIIAPDGGLELRGLTPPVTARRLGLADQRPTQVRFSPDERHVAIAAATPGRITICSLETEMAPLELDTGGPVRQMEFCCANKLLVVGHDGGQASLWAIPGGQGVGRIQPIKPPADEPGFSPRTSPTRIAIREAAVGAAPPLLATAYGNRIEVRPLPQLTGSGAPAVRASPADVLVKLQTTQDIVAIAFPPGDAQSEAGAASVDATLTTQEAVRPCERLLVITERAAIRWFDLSVRDYSAAEWRQRIAERTGMQLGDGDTPMPIPR